jgi:hypothetical protein
MNPKDLLFVATANVAHHWWCPHEAVMRSRQDESSFFGVYLQDRLNAASRLGKRLPRKRNDETVLDIGADITFKQVESLNPETRRTMKPPSDLQAKKRHASLQEYLANRPSYGVNASVRGDIYEAFLAEPYSTFRWHFPWNRFVVVGVPDGITRRFVYEFKSTRERKLLQFVKPVADAQADLYAYFYGRPGKRLQIDIVQSQTTLTFDEPANREMAISTLAFFERAVGGVFPKPPIPWKCIHCVYNQQCPIPRRR